MENNVDLEEQYIIYLLDHDAVCPLCKGMLRFMTDGFYCNDCHRVFDITAHMKFDRQVMVAERRALRRNGKSTE
ncbi:MAG: hypothetical protein J6M24_05455 [Lachnospiraceae bacterium]|nr:hypothetical protein [Lachnospiraceae bacterium]